MTSHNNFFTIRLHGNLLTQNKGLFTQNKSPYLALFLLYFKHVVNLLIDRGLIKHTTAKTNDKRQQRFGVFMTPLSFFFFITYICK